jgi:formylglycine-generating enzyme required for sulfatase activity
MRKVFLLLVMAIFLLSSCGQGGSKQQGSTPETSNSSSKSRTNGASYNPDGIELVYVEGSGSGIWAIKGFYIGKYEVTQAQWQAIMVNNPSRKQDPSHPVNRVSWYDTQQFLVKLREKTGRNYCLPTEAEWVYAANGGSNGDTYEYAGSNNLDEVAWHDKNSGFIIGDMGCYTHKVGTKKPNSIGIYDMSGNVSEWCEDCYSSSCKHRTFRGGSWFMGDALSCRVVSRDYESPDNGFGSLGFRLVIR